LCWIKHIRDQGSRLSERQNEETSSRTGVPFAAYPFIDIPLSFDVTQDIPIEVLHTDLLGIVKYFVKEMSKFIKPKKAQKIP
jgi:hypothetical protein